MVKAYYLLLYSEFNVNSFDCVGDFKMAKKRAAPYSLRLDPEMRIMAEKKAKAERRSLNAWLQIAVEEKLEKYKKQEAA